MQRKHIVDLSQPTPLCRYRLTCILENKNLQTFFVTEQIF